jgi:hypothetical protein
MRAIVALLFLAGAAHAGVPQPVDLDEPDVLDGLRANNPAHYAKVQAILVATREQPAYDLGDWMRTRFDASEVSAAPLWHVSDPPKIRLSFTLDKTRYTAMVVGRFRPAQAVPAR